MDKGMLVLLVAILMKTAVLREAIYHISVTGYGE